MWEAWKQQSSKGGTRNKEESDNDTSYVQQMGRSDEDGREGVRMQEDEERPRMQDSKAKDTKGLERVHDAG